MKLLRDNTFMNLATSYNDNPRSSIMEYVMVGDSLIFSTDPNSIKGKNLAKNPKVSLTVGNMPVFMAIDGTVTDVTAKEKEEYNKVLIKRYPQLKDVLGTDDMVFKYFRVTFKTAYYSEGMGPAEVIKMGK